MNAHSPYLFYSTSLQLPRHLSPQSPPPPLPAMVSAFGVSGHKMSTVVPATVTGEGVEHALSGMDLAMKLHYVRGVYYFEACSAVAGLGIEALKAPMFPLLSTYPQAAARIRTTSTEGRPFLKCNDSGLRIVEASSDADLASWLHQRKDTSRTRGLLPEQAIGPHLHFSPLVFVQFTRFRCGGLAVGFSWSHILGDAASASTFINTWGRILTHNNKPSNDRCTDHAASKDLPKINVNPSNTTMNINPPLPIKQVLPIEGYWLAPSDQKMEACTFHVADAEMRLVQSKTLAGAFESIASLIWKSLAKMRGGGETAVITVCRCSLDAKAGGQLGNKQIISTVSAGSSSPSEVELPELARLVAEGGRGENEAIEGWVDGEATGMPPDVVVYGANLTFVDMEEVDSYGLELRGQRPVLVEYTVGGAGDGGVVVVQRGAGDGRERAVHAILPDDEIRGLRFELASAWGVA